MTNQGDAEQYSSTGAHEHGVTEGTTPSVIRAHVVPRRRIRPQEMFALAGGFGLLAFLLVTLLNQIIHPVFPLGALLFFLYPFRNEVVARRTMQLGILAFLIWLGFVLSGVLFPFIFAFVLAYLASPLLGILAKRGIPRWISALVIVLGIISIYVLIGVFVVPTMIEQFTELTQSARDFLRDANTLLDRERLVRQLTRYGLSRAQAQEIVTNYVEPQIRNLVAGSVVWLTDFIKNISSIFEWLFTLILIPILSFYMLLEFPRIRAFVRDTLIQKEPAYLKYAVRIDDILSGYLRGILVTSSMVALLAIAILSAFDVPYSILIGLLTGVFNLIPTIGMFMNLGVAMFIFIFAPGSFWLHTLITTGMIAGLHAFNSYFVEPRFLGHRVGLHPVLLIASLFIFGYFLGFVGLLIAVPTTAIILMFLKEWYSHSVSTNQTVLTTAENPE